jgi:hypothetical protein
MIIRSTLLTFSFFASTFIVMILKSHVRLLTAPLQDHLLTVFTYITTPDRRTSASPAEKSHQS